VRERARRSPSTPTTFRKDPPRWCQRGGSLPLVDKPGTLGPGHPEPPTSHQRYLHSPSHLEGGRIYLRSQQVLTPRPRMKGPGRNVCGHAAQDLDDAPSVGLKAGLFFHDAAHCHGVPRTLLCLRAAWAREGQRCGQQACGYPPCREEGSCAHDADPGFRTGSASGRRHFCQKVLATAQGHSIPVECHDG